MRHFDIPFEELLIPLDQQDTNREILKVSPSGKVPALLDGSVTIWESLAIAEYLNEKYPKLGLWPQDTGVRAWARSIANEMHAGFASMRNHLPHDLQKSVKGFDWSPAKADVLRVFAIWNDCLIKSKGPYLFGSFSIADAMYAPVVNRLISYDVPCEGAVQKYVQAIRNLPAHQEWIATGESEKLQAPNH